MPQSYDGCRFGSIVILRKEPNKNFWHYRCDCGSLGRVYSGQIKKLKRCKQCYLRNIGDSRRTHGMCGTRIYTIWQNMKRRCFTKTDKNYPDYGGRGVTVCNKWLNFENFYKDVGDPPSAKHQLDRIDNDGNYEQGNVRWVLSSQNCRNRRSNRLIEWNGQVKTVVEWSEFLGIDHGVLRQRLYRKWPIERVLTERPISRPSSAS